MSAEEVEKRFSSIPGVERVEKVELNRKRFAHVELKVNVQEEEVLKKLKATYKNAKWRGGSLEFEKSRPNYVQRLKDEQQSQAEIVVVKEDQKVDLNDLRIRGKGKSTHNKKPKIIIFNDDDDDDRDVKPTAKAVKSLPTPVSQDLSYCCTTGDAGITKDRSVTTVDKITVEQPIKKDASDLALLASECGVPKSGKADYPKSLLGSYFTLHPNIGSDAYD